MINYDSFIKTINFEQKMGLGPHVFGASTRPNSLHSIIPSKISDEMKEACKICKQKLGLSTVLLEKKSEETFMLVEETIPGTSEKVFVIK